MERELKGKKEKGQKGRFKNVLCRRKILYFLVMVFVCMISLAACGKDKDGETVAETQKEQEMEEYLTGKHYVEISVKDMGTIHVELDADCAPITVTNFIHLVEEGFYDGLTFHRVVDGFMIQGGDPQGDGYGGSEVKIEGEFPNNGVDNPLKHTRGAISMARSKIPNSASSQFFIVHQDSPSLDGDYAVFGYVTKGMEVVDNICATATGQDYNGVLPAENQPVIERIFVVEE